MRFFTLTFFSLLISTTGAVAQTLQLQKRQKYLIDSIEVTGLKSFNPQTVISYSGLRKGQTIRIGDDVVHSVNRVNWGERKTVIHWWKVL